MSPSPSGNPLSSLQPPLPSAPAALQPVLPLSASGLASASGAASPGLASLHCDQASVTSHLSETSLDSQLLSLGQSISESFQKPQSAINDLQSSIKTAAAEAQTLVQNAMLSIKQLRNERDEAAYKTRILEQTCRQAEKSVRLHESRLVELEAKDQVRETEQLKLRAEGQAAAARIHSLLDQLAEAESRRNAAVMARTAAEANAMKAAADLLEAKDAVQDAWMIVDEGKKQLAEMSAELAALKEELSRVKSVIPIPAGDEAEQTAQPAEPVEPAPPAPTADQLDTQPLTGAATWPWPQ